MVLLTMTPGIVAAIEACQAAPSAQKPETLASEPSLSEPTVGKPISHGQLVDTSKWLRDHNEDIAASDGKAIQYHLSDLLRGSRVYQPPPKPRPAKSSEYIALMARLREEEQEREYERMLQPPPALEIFSQRSSNAQFKSLIQSGIGSSKAEEDEVTFDDVNRQLTMIINVLVTIIACSVAIWIAARHWSTPQRLGLSMTGSGVVATAEVVIYTGYLRRIKEAKQRERKLVEVKEVTDTWVIEPRKRGAVVAPGINPSRESPGSVRLRRGNS